MFLCLVVLGTYAASGDNAVKQQWFVSLQNTNIPRFARRFRKTLYKLISLFNQNKVPLKYVPINSAVEFRS
jgi:hypothetical protein